jgi:hypothetical protein
MVARQNQEEHSSQVYFDVASADEHWLQSIAGKEATLDTNAPVRMVATMAASA